MRIYFSATRSATVRSDPEDLISHRGAHIMLTFYEMTPAGRQQRRVRERLVRYLRLTDNLRRNL